MTNYSLLSFGFSDNPDNVVTFPYSNFEVLMDATKVINYISVEGGYKRELLSEFIEPIEFIIRIFTNN